MATIVEIEAKADRYRSRVQICSKCGYVDSTLSSEWAISNSRGIRDAKKFCRKCEALVAESQRLNEEAKLRGYPEHSRTPEYKQMARRRMAAACGLTVAPYISASERRLAAQARHVEEIALRVKNRAISTFRKIYDQCYEAIRYQVDDRYRDSKKRSVRRLYWSDPEIHRNRQRVYKHSNPDKVAAWGDKRRVLVSQQADGSLTTRAVRSLFASAVSCPYCLRSFDGDKTLDHIIPVSKGGLHTLQNAIICCRECNVKKGNKDFTDWLAGLPTSIKTKLLRMYRSRFSAPPSQQTLGLTWAG